jgi:DNA-binding MarR family transcriptional regulator
MTNSSAYLRFLNLSQAVAEDWTDIDQIALRTLEAIAVADAKNTPLTVTEAMSMNAIASPATMHRKLDQLREAGLIAQVHVGTNRRTKYLVITNQAHKYFEQLGNAMVKAFTRSQVAQTQHHR